ncbi:MAG: helix-turn-helix domain-containing protein [Acidobacteria bacterium]|nr:MAG: helix-turn-helix domain-containing protein [Acidobacteriota bacterium]
MQHQSSFRERSDLPKTSNSSEIRAMFNGDAIRDLREKLRWSRPELASYLAVPEEEVASWESERSQPTNEQLGALYRLANSNLIPFDPFSRVRPLQTALPDPFVEPRLHRVKTLVETCYTDPIGLREAAAAACLEPKYFSKYFQKRVGRSFSVWLAGFRIEKATELLVKTDQPVSAIGYAVGFQCLRTFERTFKRLTGWCPAKFRSKRRLLS